MTLTEIAQRFANAITSQLGVILIIIAVAIAGLRVAFSGGHHVGGLGWALTGGAVALSAAWLVQTYLGAGVTGI